MSVSARTTVLHASQVILVTGVVGCSVPKGEAITPALVGSRMVAPLGGPRNPKINWMRIIHIRVAKMRIAIQAMEGRNRCVQESVSRLRLS